MTYEVKLVPFDEVFERLEPLLRQHYGEMAERFAKMGMPLSPYNPRWAQYRRSAADGWLLVFILEHDGELVGDCMVYITNDMHNGDLIAREDTIYVVPQHRYGGAGRQLARAVHEELKRRGVTRLDVTTATDLRVARWLEYLGYKHTAHCMTLNLQEH